MKTVTITLKFQFETEEVDDDTLKEALTMAFEERAENDELLDKAKINIKDDDEEDEDYEEDEE